MCTVSIVPRDDGFRLVCNRDELLSRPAALPPRWTRHHELRAVYPIDPLRGGTWLALNGRGLALALLNRHAPPKARRMPRPVVALRSRGEIPLALIDAASVDEIRQRLRALDVAAYPPFLLLAVWFDRLLTAEGDAGRLVANDTRLDAPVAFTSSSLGDADAERIRLPLFRALLERNADPWTAQRAFHDHHWPDRPEVSVRMQRADARTVSRTRIDVKGTGAVLDYEPLSAVPLRRA